MRIARFVLRAALIGVAFAASTAVAQTTPRFRVDTWSTDDGLPSTFISDLVESRDGFLWLAAGGTLARFDGFEFRVFNSASDSLITARVNFLYAGAGDTVWVTLDDASVLSVSGTRLARLGQFPTRAFGAIAHDRRGRLTGFGGDMLASWDGTRFQEQQLPQGWLTPGTYPVFSHAVDGDIWLLDQRGDVLRIGDRGAERMGKTTAGTLVRYPSRRQVLLVRKNGALSEVVDGTGVVLASYRDAPQVQPILIDRRGRLWAKTPQGVQVYVPGLPDPLDRIDLSNPGELNRMMEDRAGNIWVSGTGLARIQEMAFRTLVTTARASGLLQQVGALTPGSDGSVLTQGTMQHPGVFRWDGARFTPFVPGIASAKTDARGTVWVVEGNEGPLTGRRNGVAELRLPVRAQNPLVLRDDPSRPGSFWVLGERAVYRAEPYAPGGPRITDSLVFDTYPRVFAIAPDGSLWVISSRDRVQHQQLTRLAGGERRDWSREDGLPVAMIRAVVPDSGGSVWLGTYGGGLVRLSEDRFQSITARDGLAEDIVSDILLDDAGNFWIGGNRSVHRVAREEAIAFLEGRIPRIHGVAYGKRDGLSDPETSGDLGLRAVDGKLWFPTFGGAGVVDPVHALALDNTPPLVHVLGIRTTGDTLQPSSTTRLPRGQRRIAIAYTAIDLRSPDRLRFEYRLDGVDDDWIYAAAGRVAVYNDVGPGQHTFRVRARNAGGVWSTEEASLAFTVPAYFHETTAFYLLVATLLIASARFLWVARTRQLRRRQEELRAMVDSRTAELGNALVLVEAQASQLRTLDEAKSRFFANVSHEFRTPLSLILGPVEDVRDGRAGPLPELARQRLGSVLNNGRRLVQLVEQLLDVARLESGTLTLRAEVRDLVPLLRRISESFSSLAERRGLGFRVSCPVGGMRVRHDPDQMEKVFGNLLGNALKFTPTGGRVELRAQVEGDGAEGHAVVEVEDTGPGIPAAHQSRVFDRFYQVDDSPRRAHEGAGIGLALARELVDLHGGSLSLRSVEGAGSTFIVRLPLATGELHVSGDVAIRRSGDDVRAAAFAGSALAAPRSGLAAAGPAGDDVTTVLVAEDNAELLAYLREHLADQYRVIEAGNGAQALKLAREHVPDLIVSDVMMPEMDGQALCQAIKSDPETDFIPVILLTAKASRESRLAGLEGGADDYLAKPVDMRELLVRAANLITGRRRLKERWQAERRDLPTLPAPHPTAPPDAGSDAFLRKLYAVMAEHVGDEDFQVDALAAAVAMGRSTLYRKLEALTGRSPMDVLWDYRLEQAAQWLGETDANVSEIAYGVGFKSVPHFCARFRERFGHSPSAYRKRQVRSAGGDQPPAV